MKSGLSYKRSKKITFFITVCFLLFLISGCGDNEASKSGPDPNLRTGRFIDSPVQGLAYASKTQSGFTDASGSFKYLPGETISFSVGKIHLGTSTGREIVTPIHLVSGAKSASHPDVIKIASFLQTLDADGQASNGIEIPAQAAEIIDDTFDYDGGNLTISNGLSDALLEAIPELGLGFDFIFGLGGGFEVIQEGVDVGTGGGVDLTYIFEPGIAKGTESAIVHAENTHQAALGISFLNLRLMRSKVFNYLFNEFNSAGIFKDGDHSQVSDLDAIAHLNATLLALSDIGENLPGIDILEIAEEMMDNVLTPDDYRLINVALASVQHAVENQFDTGDIDIEETLYDYSYDITEEYGRISGAGDISVTEFEAYPVTFEGLTFDDSCCLPTSGQMVLLVEDSIITLDFSNTSCSDPKAICVKNLTAGTLALKPSLCTYIGL